MATQSIDLVDRSSTKIAVLSVEPGGDRYHGTICLDATPPDLSHLFEEFERNVEGQMFTLADEVEEKIGVIALRVVFPNGLEADIEDLQVYPSTKRVSFKVRQPSVAAENAKPSRVDPAGKLSANEWMQRTGPA